MTMPRNKLIQERIELRRWQPLDRLPRRPHFQHVGWAVYEWPFAQCRANDPGGHVEMVILRVHLAGIKADLLSWKGSGAKLISPVSSRSALSQSLQGSAGPQIDH